MEENLNLYLTLAAVVVVLVSLMVSGGAAGRRQNVYDFYFAKKNLKWLDSSLLLWASSLSLNGLFYHTFLGYTIGIWSFFIQIIWCGGYLFLAYHRKGLLPLVSRGSLPTNFNIVYGNSDAKIVSLISIYVFIALVGWEIAIATSFANSAFDIDGIGTYLFIGILLFSIVTYTIRGGVKANLNANRFHMILKIIGFGIVCYAAWKTMSLVDITTDIDIQSENKGLVDRFKWNPVDALIALGGPIILLVNASFSFFWQSADTQTWQNLTASEEARKNPRLTLWASAIGILIGPGLLGTVLGMSMAHYEGLSNDSAVLLMLLENLSTDPLIAMLLIAAMVAAMMSTIDGMLLGISLTFLSGFSKDKDVLVLEVKPNAESIDSVEISQNERESQISTAPYVDDTRLLTKAQIMIFVAGLLSVFGYILVEAKVVGLFELVYIAVVGQMAIAPSAINLFVSRDENSARSRNSKASMLIGFSAGMVFVCLGLLKVDNISFDLIGDLPWIITAPLISLLGATIGLFITSRSNVKRN